VKALQSISQRFQRQSIELEFGAVTAVEGEDAFIFRLSANMSFAIAIPVCIAIGGAFRFGLLLIVSKSSGHNKSKEENVECLHKTPIKLIFL